jgi:dihydroorotate dehydrogenase
VKLYPIFRWLLFRLNPERAHALSLRWMEIVSGVPLFAWGMNRIFSSTAKPVQAFGLTFANPLGLAAGYDKDGTAWRGLACLGFGHIEVGTVTLHPQPGNPKPRLFRLIGEQAIINRMGFPGRGAEFVIHQLEKPRPPGLIIGVNIGKNKDTPLDNAVQDYRDLLKLFAPLADYIAINISSPNTIGLRRLQARDELESLMGVLVGQRNEYIKQHLTRTPNLPLLVKLAPDLGNKELEDAIEVILRLGIDGIIATNTTLQRPVTANHINGETGGLSGAPLFSISLKMVKTIVNHTQGRLPVIGVGGIHNKIGVQQMLDTGAILVQLYTGLVYEGPGLVKNILREL